MKVLMHCAFLILLCSGNVHPQNIYGVWYGYGYPKQQSSTNNYLIELTVLEGRGNEVYGTLNFYFKNIHTSMAYAGVYRQSNRMLYIKDAHIAYHASITDMEVDCTMDIAGTFIINSRNSILQGTFYNAVAENRLTCPDVTFHLIKSKEGLNIDSLKHIATIERVKHKKWEPDYEVGIRIPSAVSTETEPNPTIEQEFKKRPKTIAKKLTLTSDTLHIDFYDNGQIDGDTISVFLDDKLISEPKRLGSNSIKLTIILPDDKAEHEIGMYANNLGEISPNTALMTIRNGIHRYQIRLSSDLERSATIKLSKENSD